MRVSFFIISNNLGLGGIQTMIVNIANTLSNHRSETPIYILLRKKRAFNSGRKIKNKNVRIVNYLDWLKIKVPLFFPSFVLYYTWKLRPKAILAFSDAQALPAIGSKLLLFWRGIRVVVREDRHVSKEVSAYRFAPLRHFLIRLFYPFADVIFAPSKSRAKDLIEFYSLPKKKVKIVPNWTTLVNKKITPRQKKYDLIYVGRLAKNKNLKFLLRGVKRLIKYKKDVTLCLVGGGEEEKRLRSWVKHNNVGGNIIFIGTKYEVEDYLSRAKIFVLASKDEGAPLAILEAMAAKLPVLSYNYPGVEEIIKEGETGFIYKNLTEFVKKTLMLLQNSAKREKIGQKARDCVKKHHSPDNIKIYLKALGL